MNFFTGYQNHYATVFFSVNVLNTWDGACWQALIDYGIYQCFEEFPCTYERQITANYTDGPDAITDYEPRVAISGSDCTGTGPGGTAQWMIGGPGFNHQVWYDLWGISCGEDCTVGLGFDCQYGNNVGPVYVTVVAPTTTSFSHQYACTECM
jgi:hypothetical protein